MTDLKEKIRQRIERLEEPEFKELPEIPHQIAELRWILKDLE